MKSIAEASETLHAVAGRVININGRRREPVTSGFMSVMEAAAIARMCPKTLHKLIRQGKIRALGAGARHAYCFPTFCPSAVNSSGKGLVATLTRWLRRPWAPCLPIAHENCLAGLKTRPRAIYGEQVTVPIDQAGSEPAKPMPRSR
jgi:hypothetical protein